MNEDIIEQRIEEFFANTKEEDLIKLIEDVKQWCAENPADYSFFNLTEEEFWRQCRKE